MGTDYYFLVDGQMDDLPFVINVISRLSEYSGNALEKNRYGLMFYADYVQKGLKFSVKDPYETKQCVDNLVSYSIFKRSLLDILENSDKYCQRPVYPDYYGCVELAFKYINDNICWINEGKFIYIFTNNRPNDPKNNSVSWIEQKQYLTDIGAMIKIFHYTNNESMRVALSELGTDDNCLFVIKKEEPFHPKFY